MIEDDAMKKIIVIIGIVGIYFVSLTWALHGLTNVYDGEEWNSTFGGNGFDAFEDILKVEDGYICGGYSSEYKDENFDAWVVKVNKYGDELWGKTYGGEKEDGIKCIIKGIDGYILGGYTASYGNGDYDFWIVKIDDNGNEIWNKTYGGIHTEYASDIISTSDEGYAIVGSVFSNQSTESDIMLIKVDGNGNKEWTSVFGDGKDEWAESMLQTEDGGYLIAGRTSSYGSNLWDIWLIKTDENGNEMWNKTYGLWDMEWAETIIDTEDGYVVGGKTTSTSTGHTYAWIIKINKDGNEMWNKTYGGGEGDHLNALAKTDNGFIFVGTTASYDVAQFDAWLVKIDEEGREIWNKSFGTRDREIAYNVLYDNESYVICGLKGGYHAFPDGWIIKCTDYVPPRLEITKPKNYFYLFNRELFPADIPTIIGGITVVTEIYNSIETVNQVEFYLNGHGVFDYEPRATVDKPPYEWKWDSFAIGWYEGYCITAGAYYGNAGGVAADHIWVRIINIFSPSSSFHDQKLTF